MKTGPTGRTRSSYRSGQADFSDLTSGDRILKGDVWPAAPLYYGAMADPKGDKLFVNLGASQVRRRLKGFGHGVRKVQATGRNQTVIIHTATGRHLAELEGKFADVGIANTESGLSDPIENVLNLGAASAAWLREVEIRTIADLRSIGPALAYRRVKARNPSTSLNLLWAMAAGLADRDPRDLSDEEKARLLKEAEDGD